MPKVTLRARMTEAELQRNVVDLAALKGYLHYHTHDSRRSDPGFPDLVLVKGARLIFVELKSAKGKLTDDQAAWLRALRCVPGVEAHCWFPDQWLDGTIEAVLA